MAAKSPKENRDNNQLKDLEYARRMVNTPLDTLLDEVEYAGLTEKERLVNHTVFLTFRDILGKFDQALTNDNKAVLIRHLKMSFKPEI